MSKEQFCQVVLLPQGDFARFLRADAEARSRLLGRLFDTRRFAALEEQLNARRKTAADTVTAGDERLLALAHRMAQAAGESADLTDPSVPAPDRAGAGAGGRSGARTRCRRGRRARPGEGDGRDKGDDRDKRDGHGDRAGAGRSPWRAADGAGRPRRPVPAPRKTRPHPAPASRASPRRCWSGQPSPG